MLLEYGFWDKWPIVSGSMFSVMYNTCGSSHPTNMNVIIWGNLSENDFQNNDLHENESKISSEGNFQLLSYVYLNFDFGRNGP